MDEGVTSAEKWTAVEPKPNIRARRLIAFLCHHLYDPLMGGAKKAQGRLEAEVAEAKRDGGGAEAPRRKVEGSDEAEAESEQEGNEQSPAGGGGGVGVPGMGSTAG